MTQPQSRKSESLGMDRSALVEYAQAVFDEDLKARNGNGGRPGTSTELLLAMGVLEHLRCAPSESGAREAARELSNIANAERFNRERFRDDTEFADWAQSRCRHTLSRIE
jgi:hypothetical protein